MQSNDLYVTVVAHAGGPDRSCTVVELYSFSQMSVTSGCPNGHGRLQIRVPPEPMKSGASDFGSPARNQFHLSLTALATTRWVLSYPISQSREIRTPLKHRETERLD